MREQGPMTEAVFYTMMILSKQNVCGTEIAAEVERRTQGRVRLGPGTLYTILRKVTEQNLIQEIEVEGRKRTYQITEEGLRAYQTELNRLKCCIQDAEEGDR